MRFKTGKSTKAIHITLLVAPLLPSLGCGFMDRLPLYREYKQIELGEPVPDHVGADPDWGARRNTHWWHGTGASERARYLVDDDGRVYAKKYAGGGEKGSLLLMWYQARGRSEWELLLPREALAGTKGRSSAGDEILRVCRELEDLKSPEEPWDALELAQQRGRLDGGRLRLRRLKDLKLAPMVERTIWRVASDGEGEYRIVVEEKQDLSLIVWTLMSWVGILIGKGPHG